MKHLPLKAWVSSSFKSIKLYLSLKKEILENIQIWKANCRSKKSEYRSNVEGLVLLERKIHERSKFEGPVVLEKSLELYKFICPLTKSWRSSKFGGLDVLGLEGLYKPLQTSTTGPWRKLLKIYSENMCPLKKSEYRSKAILVVLEKSLEKKKKQHLKALVSLKKILVALEKILKDLYVWRTYCSCIKSLKFLRGPETMFFLFIKRSWELKPTFLYLDVLGKL